MLAAILYGESQGDEKRQGHRQSRQRETKEPVLFVIGANRCQCCIDQHIQQKCRQRRGNTGDEDAVVGEFCHSNVFPFGPLEGSPESYVSRRVSYGSTL